MGSRSPRDPGLMGSSCLWSRCIRLFIFENSRFATARHHGGPHHTLLFRSCTVTACGRMVQFKLSVCVTQVASWPTVLRAVLVRFARQRSDIGSICRPPFGLWPRSLSSSWTSLRSGLIEAREEPKAGPGPCENFKIGIPPKTLRRGYLAFGPHRIL